MNTGDFVDKKCFIHSYRNYVNYFVFLNTLISIDTISVTMFNIKAVRNILRQNCVPFVSFKILRKIKQAVVWSRVLACWAQTCRCTSSGCTTCAVRRRRYGRSDRNVAEAARAVNLGPITLTSPNRRLDLCNAATGSIEARAGSLNGPLYNLATRLTKSPSRYRGKLLICTLLPRNFLRSMVSFG